MMRNPARTVQSTWFLMVVLQAIGSIDAQHRLPAPRKFVAIGAVWGTLFLITDTGMGRLAARLSVLMLITATVLGPFGARLITILQNITRNFAVPPATGTQTPGASPGTTPAPVISRFSHA